MTYRAVRAKQRAWTLLRSRATRYVSELQVFRTWKVGNCLSVLWQASVRSWVKEIPNMRRQWGNLKGDIPHSNSEAMVKFTLKLLHRCSIGWPLGMEPWEKHRDGCPDPAVLVLWISAKVKLWNLGSHEDEDPSVLEMNLNVGFLNCHSGRSQYGYLVSWEHWNWRKWKDDLLDSERTWCCWLKTGTVG